VGSVSRILTRGGASYGPLDLTVFHWTQRCSSQDPLLASHNEPDPPSSVTVSRDFAMHLIAEDVGFAD
jgi:hypothetical protein